jgi:hypothetical protein
MLTPHQRVLLEHVLRYRCTHVQALKRTCFENQTTAAARSAIDRLLRAGLLCVAVRLPSKTIYQLTPQAAVLLGAPQSAARPLRSQGTRRRCGVLDYCSLGPVKRTLLTPEEFQMSYPRPAREAGIDATQQDYLQIDEAGVEHLAQLTVDSGAQRHSVIRKCRKLLSRAQETPVFRELLRQDRFRLIVLVATESKARELEAQLADLHEQDLTFTAPVRVEVVPSLKELPGDIYNE